MKIIIAFGILTTILTGCSPKSKTPQEQVIGKWQIEKTTLYRTSLGKELTLKSNDKVDTTVFDFPIITSLDINKQGDFFAFENANTIIKSQWLIEPKKLLLRNYEGSEREFVLDTLTNNELVLSLIFNEYDTANTITGEKSKNVFHQNIPQKIEKEIRQKLDTFISELKKKGGSVTKEVNQFPPITGKEIRKYFFVKTNS